MSLIVRISTGFNNSDTSTGGGSIRNSLNNKMNVFVEGYPIAIVSDKLTSHGDHHGQFDIITGSLGVRAYGFNVARTGDLASCGHSLISGALKTNAG